MRITKEDSVIDSITTEVNGSSGSIHITFKNRGKALAIYNGHVTSLIKLGAQVGITLHQRSDMPIVLVSRDLKQYGDLLTLLFKYNYMSHYDWNKMQASVVDVAQHLSAAAKPKSVVAPVRRKTLRGDADTDITGGFVGDIFDIFDILDKATPILKEVHPNSLFATASSASSARSQPSAPLQPSLQSNEGIPRNFLCPITGEIMSDPVMFLRDQWTYERSAIEAILREGKVSPVSNIGMEPGDRLEDVLIPNWAFKATIDAFKAENPELFNNGLKSMTA